MHDGDDASCRNLYQTTATATAGCHPQPWLAILPRPEAVHFAWADTAGDRRDRSGNPWELLEHGRRDAIPVILDKNTAVYSLHLYGGIGEEFELDYGSAGRLRFRVVGLLSNSILQGSLMVSEAELLRVFPQISGYRFFLIDCPSRSEPPDRPNAGRPVQRPRISDHARRATCCSICWRSRTPTCRRFRASVGWGYCWEHSAWSPCSCGVSSSDGASWLCCGRWALPPVELPRSSCWSTWCSY